MSDLIANNKPVNKVKKPNNKTKTTSLTVEIPTRRQILAILNKINRKSYGRRIKINDLILKYVELTSPEVIKELQDSSLSHTDRVEIEYKEYVSKNGYISKDEFFGKLLTKFKGENRLATTPERSNLQEI